MERSFTEAEALFEQACGILACRLEIDREAAGQILDRVSRREGVSRGELVANVIASCTGSAVLPRDLSGNGYGYESAA
jgi:hypothetical protein